MRKFSALLLALILTLTAASTALADWPVASRYSWVSQWYSSHHRAIDIAARKGTRLVPAASGTVVFAGWRNNCGGWQVWVYIGNGRYITYAHMLYRPRVVKGQHVYRSLTTLGYVGMSGTPPSYAPSMVCATGYHVHFEEWSGRPWASGSYRFNPWHLIDRGYWLPYRYR